MSKPIIADESRIKLMIASYDVRSLERNKEKFLDKVPEAVAKKLLESEKIFKEFCSSNKDTGS